MARNANEYRIMLNALLPPGRALNLTISSGLTKIVLAIADGLAALDIRIGNLRDEADPFTTTEAITDWERIVGLPDQCGPVADTIEQRRLDIVSKLAHSGTISIPFLEEFVTNLGLTPTIFEFPSFRMGVGAMGDAINGKAMNFAIKILLAETAPQVFFRMNRNTIGLGPTELGAMGDPLQFTGIADFECKVRTQATRANNTVFFEYAGVTP